MADLSEAGREEVRQWAAGQRHGAQRRTCPDCSALRSAANRKTQCLSITVDHEHVTYTCWHCHAQGAAQLGDAKADRTKPMTPYVPRSTAKLSTGKAIKEIGSSLDALALAFLKKRGISQDTAAVFGVTYARAYFPQLERETHGLALPYIVDDKTVGHKVRSSEDKAHVCAPALYTLFGLQNVDVKECSHFLIAEGEWDALAFYEAGVLNATSVPNGSSSFTRGGSDTDPQAVYGFLWTAKKQIDAAKKILIATDMDEEGEKLANELARRIGKHRCWRVRFPDDCKDANDTLLKHGEAALKACAAKAEPWPIDGLYEADKFYPEVMDLFRNGFGEKIVSGMAPVDELYSVGKGLLTVVTGAPGNGKSTFVDMLMVSLARRYGYIAGICSFENPPHVHIAKLAEMMLQKHFFETDLPGQKMTEGDLRSVQPFINDHFKFLFQEDGNKATLDSIIERIKTAVFRWGIQMAVIDPYNYIARPKDAESETQWIDDMLTRLRLLAASHDLHLWFVAHPTKLQMDAEGHYPPPKGYSISGSAAWYSKADFGLTIHKVPDQPGLVRFINWKTRFDWLGREGEAKLLYDNTKNIYIVDLMNDMLPYKEDGPVSYSEARH